MKVTKQYLKQVIKEELQRVVEEKIPTLPELVDTLESHLKRGFDFRKSDYSRTLDWYIERHPQKEQLNSLLINALGFGRRAKQIPTPEIGPRATKVDPNDENLLKALQAVKKMKELASQQA